MPRPIAVGLLLLCTALWGFAFVAQKTAMDAMGPLTFAAIRYALGTILVLPLAVLEYQRLKTEITPRQWLAIAALAGVFFLGVYFQQVGLTLTTVTNSGFLTGLYVLFVPFLALIAFRHRPHPVVWICMPLAFFGIFCLNGGRFDQLNLGDGLVIISAVCWAIQILVVGILSRWTGLPVTISVLCFFATSVFSLIGAFAFETPTLSALGDGWFEILYAGVLSTAVAFTLQAIAQQHVPPSNAAIILAAESLFAFIGGSLILGERLPPLGYAGAAMIFVAVLTVEAVPMLTRKEAAQAA
jgi:drug/metabolite transporter (DMT)-like permease